MRRRDKAGQPVGVDEDSRHASPIAGGAIERREMPILQAQVGADEDNLAGEESTGQKADAEGRNVRERRRVVVGPVIEGELDPIGDGQRCAGDFGEGGGESRGRLAEQRLSNRHLADDLVRGVLQQLDGCHAGAGPGAAQIRDLSLAKPVLGVRSGDHHRDRQTLQGFSKPGIFLRLGRLVEQDVEADGCRPLRRHVRHQCAQKMAVDRRPIGQGRHQGLVEGDHGNGRVLRRGCGEMGDPQVADPAFRDDGEGQKPQRRPYHCGDGNGDQDGRRGSPPPCDRLGARHRHPRCHSGNRVSKPAQQGPRLGSVAAGGHPGNGHLVGLEGLRGNIQFDADDPRTEAQLVGGPVRQRYARWPFEFAAARGH